MTVYVLALDVPGRYIVGEAELSVDHWRDQGHIHLKNPSWVTLMNDQWTFQPITLMDEFVADLASYAGFGVANGDCLKHYQSWLEHFKNPPDFGVEEDSSEEALR